MKIRRVAGVAPALSWLGAVCVLGAAVVQAATAADLAPPPMAFTQDGHAYQWSVAHGVTGSLSISREIDPPAVARQPTHALGDQVAVKTYESDLVLTCSGLHSGGFQARFYAPQGGAAQLRLTAGPSVFRVYRGVGGDAAHAFVEGHGDLPDNFFAALADAPTVSVAYGDKVTTFPGPGKALTAHFQRYCASLAQRASRDE